MELLLRDRAVVLYMYTVTVLAARRRMQYVSYRASWSAPGVECVRSRGGGHIALGGHGAGAE